MFNILDGEVEDFPDLTGYFSYGITLMDAKANAIEALDLYLEEAKFDISA